MTREDEYPADTYANLSRAYLDMDLIDDAYQTVRAGLARYPTDAVLLKLLDDPRLSAKRS
jgi:hypothetical protein